MFCLSYDFTKMDKGSGRPSLVKSDLLEIKIPLPPIKEQANFVKTLEKLSVHKKNLESTYNQKLLDLEELKKSILNKAFKGEL